MDDYNFYFKRAPWASHHDNINTVVIEHGVKSIGDGTFYNCSGLTSINIPESVTSLGDYAFSDCSSLTQMTVLATTPPTVNIQP